MDGSDNRRSYVRHHDDVLLRLRPLDEHALRTTLERLEHWRRDYDPGKELQLDSRQLRPALREIRREMPEVAAYLSHLERRIATLSGTTDGDAPRGESTPVRVDLSASGLRCTASEGLHEGVAVEVGLVLLPRCEEVAAIGRVVRLEPAEEGRPGTASIHFEHLLEHDQETLIRHVHALQRRSLQRRRRTF